MADASLAFVDAISSSPTVLLDLSDGSSFRLTDWRAPAPELARTLTSSRLFDGAFDAARSYQPREITFEVLCDKSTEDALATEFQKILRLIGGPQWLRYVPEGSSRAVFFRTFAASPAEIDEFRAVEPGTKTMTVALLADPFGYGEKETFSTTVTNDPTDSNGMRFTVSGVKGDVPAPLRLECALSSDAVKRLAIGSSSDSAFLDADNPYPTVPNPWWSTWSPSTPSDVSAIGGTYSRASTDGTKGAGTLIAATVPSAHPGDYRVLVRARASAAASLRMVTVITGSDMRLDDDARPVSSSWSWIDLGVQRFPRFSRAGSPWSPGVAVTNESVDFAAILSNPAVASTVDVDRVVLLPAPGRDGSDAQLLLASKPAITADMVSVDDFVLDGQTESMWSLATAGMQPSWECAGGFPLVRPGVTNLVTLAHLSDGVTDDKTMTWAISGSYHPRYFYVRGD